MLSFRGLVLHSSRSIRRVSRSARAILEDDSAAIDLSEDNEAVDGMRQRNAGPPTTPTPAVWQVHRDSLKAAFPDGWNPPRKLSREAMDGLRQLHRINPETFSTPVLADRFRISPEAVRRILKSRWAPSTSRRMQLLKREAETRIDKNSHERERIETEQVLQSKRDLRAARQSDESTGAVKGVHPRDRLTFE